MMDAEDLPDGWECATVKELCGQPQYGYTESARHDAVGPKFLRITDIQEGDVNWDSVPFCPCDETSKYRLADGDILFARTGATTGKSYLVHNPPESVFASYLIRIRPGTRVLPEYVWWYFQSSGYWASVFGGIDDGNRPNMSGSKLAALRLPFPKSKTEQRRLVARIETLTSRLEKARQARNEAFSEADMVFQRALAISFGDEETEDWSEYGADELFEIVSGQVSPLDPEFSGLPYLGPEHVEVGTGRIIGERVSVAELKMKSGKYRFTPEHVVYSKIRPALRKVCTPDYSGLCSADMYALQPNPARISREFLKFLLLAPTFSDYAVEKSDRNAMPKINQAALRAFRFRVPQLEEQERITHLLNSILIKHAELRRLQTETEAELAAFTPALLAKAFRGEL
ncbi:MAG: restriction endonuclease subunit S [Verrucomicrobiaceae bacterium]|nr:restriction endonuclease subunit S [Verrucomicrobiaceae bacterium]